MSIGGAVDLYEELGLDLVDLLPIPEFSFFIRRPCNNKMLLVSKLVRVSLISRSNMWIFLLLQVAQVVLSTRNSLVSMDLRVKTY
jgi:hypothetical protein